MKKVFLLMSVIGLLGACSSKEKTAEMDAKATEATAKVEATQAAATETKAAATGSATSATCKLDKDERIIDVRKTESGGCELFYTKFGEEKSVASSGFGTQYCEEVKDRIQSNLAKAGFSCQ